MTDLRKQIAFAISDPGHAGEGYKQDRTLTEWQTDAVLRVLAASLCASPIIEGLTPTGADWEACQTLQDRYNLMKHLIAKTFRGEL